MQKNQGMEEEKLWRVRFIYKSDLARYPEGVPQQENAFFYARNEAALHKRVAGWQHYSKHDGVIVQEIEQVPLGFNLHFYPGLLEELPAEQAEAVLRLYVSN